MRSGRKVWQSSRSYCDENILSYCAMIIYQVKILRENSSCTKSKVNPISIRWICSHGQNCRTILSAIYVLTWPLLQSNQIGFLPHLYPERRNLFGSVRNHGIFFRFDNSVRSQKRSSSGHRFVKKLIFLEYSMLHASSPNENHVSMKA
jgi:hypothetical protein